MTVYTAYCYDCITKLRLSVSPFHGGFEAWFDDDWQEEQGICAHCKAQGDIIVPQRTLQKQRDLEMEIKIIRLFYEEYVDGTKHTVGRFEYTEDYQDFVGGLPKYLDKERSIIRAKARREERHG